MKFHVLPKGESPTGGQDEVYLTIDHWKDFPFETRFVVHAFDKNGDGHALSGVRIGLIGQTWEVETHTKLPRVPFDKLPEKFFSLGMDVDYYKDLFAKFDEAWRSTFLTALRDVVWDESILERVQNEEVFQTSHLRSISMSMIRDQFTSVLRGDVLLTDFDFGFCLPPSPSFAGFDLSFRVKANSIPSTNMHALIGRNGVGKTRLINEMVKAISKSVDAKAWLYTNDSGARSPIDDDFFSSLVLVSFSVFDPFDFPEENTGRRYSCIGLIEYADEDHSKIKSKESLFEEFTEGLEFCFSDDRRKNRWIQAIETLQSDENFSEMGLLSLSEPGSHDLRERALFLIKKMSSGHAVVILTMTLLVAKVQEKTLVLFDEPESHLHPPLLSALIRSLSQLLYTRNAVAIVATHSPVVLQEIPRSCVWKVHRSKLASNKKRPDTETFGENVGTLTREVFGLEVERSGFHTVLLDLVESGETYDNLVLRLGGSLGNEAKGILKAMVVNRDSRFD